MKIYSIICSKKLARPRFVGEVENAERQEQQTTCGAKWRME